MACAGEGGFGEAEGAFEGGVAFEGVWDFGGGAVVAPTHHAESPGEEAAHGHREVAAVEDAVGERAGRQAFERGGAETEVKAGERGVVAVEVGEAFGHLGERIQIIGIEEHCAGAAVGGDAGDADFERAREDARVGEFVIHDWHGAFAAGVGEERQFRLGHAFEEAGVAAVVPVDALDVGQAFERGGATGNGEFEFVEGVFARGMDRNGSEELGVLLREFQDVGVGDVEGSAFGDGRAVVAVGEFVGEDEGALDGGAVEVVEELVDVDAVEVRAVEVAGGEADGADEEGRAEFGEAAGAVPAAGAAGACTDDVDMGVDAHGDRKSLKRGRAETRNFGVGVLDRIYGMNRIGGMELVEDGLWGAAFFGVVEVGPSLDVVAVGKAGGDFVGGDSL